MKIRREFLVYEEEKTDLPGKLWMYNLYCGLHYINWSGLFLHFVPPQTPHRIPTITFEKAKYVLVFLFFSDFHDKVKIDVEFSNLHQKQLYFITYF